MQAYKMVQYFISTNPGTVNLKQFRPSASDWGVDTRTKHCLYFWYHPIAIIISSSSQKKKIWERCNLYFYTQKIDFNVF
jgi:hypothetical protein